MIQKIGAHTYLRNRIVNNNRSASRRSLRANGNSQRITRIPIRKLPVHSRCRRRKGNTNRVEVRGSPRVIRRFGIDVVALERFGGPDKLGTAVCCEGGTGDPTERGRIVEDATTGADEVNDTGQLGRGGVSRGSRSRSDKDLQLAQRRLRWER